MAEIWHPWHPCQKKSRVPGTRGTRPYEVPEFLAFSIQESYIHDASMLDIILDTNFLPNIYMKVVTFLSFV